MKCLIHGLVNEMSQLVLEHTRLVRTIIGLFILYLSLIFFFIAHGSKKKQRRIKTNHFFDIPS